MLHLSSLAAVGLAADHLLCWVVGRTGNPEPHVPWAESLVTAGGQTSPHQKVSLRYRKVERDQVRFHLQWETLSLG